MVIEYVPWGNLDVAKQELADYVSQHPDSKLIFDSNTSRPDTTFLTDGDTPIAEISTKFIHTGYADNTELCPGLSYRTVWNNTPKKENVQEVQEQTESYYRQAVNWLNEHKKTTLTGMGTFAGIMLLYVGCEVKNIYFHAVNIPEKVDPAVANTPGYKLQKDINQAKVFLGDDSPIQLDKNGYARLVKSYSSKAAEYRKKKLDAEKISELEELVKQFQEKAK